MLNVVMQNAIMLNVVVPFYNLHEYLGEDGDLFSVKPKQNIQNTKTLSAPLRQTV
jgi:hypothetical protein